MDDSMGELIFINNSSVTLPKDFLRRWLGAIERRLPSGDRRRVKRAALTVVFLDTGPARKLNRDFRDRDYATDVLSFPSGDGESLGDLAICPQVVRRQAAELDLSFKAELGYMVLHGLLHLLGYDHEGGKREAEKMFRLQDKIFRALCGRLAGPTPKRKTKTDRRRRTR
jgi:probable rRNA maturation factor